MICHFSCGEKEKLLVGDLLELACCSSNEDDCDRFFKKLDTYKDNIADFDLDNILDDLFSLRQIIKLKNTVISSLRDTIEILKDSANRSAEDSRRYDLQCQDTISALKFALGLRDINNSKAGDGAVEVSPRMPALQSIAPSSEGRERGLVSRRRATMETGGGPIRGIKVAPIGGGPNKFPKNSTRAAGGLSPALTSRDPRGASDSGGAGGPVRSKTGRRITGSLAPLESGIKSAPNYKWYYISRLSMDTNAEALSVFVKENILKAENVEVEILELNTRLENRLFKSFRVGVPHDCDVDLLDPDFWPLNITVEPSFRPRRPPSNQSGRRQYNYRSGRGGTYREAP